MRAPVLPESVPALILLVAAVTAAAPSFAAEDAAPLVLTAGLSDGGSSSRDSRQRAIDAMPLGRMEASQRRAVEKQLKSTTLYRRLPVETFTCDADLLEFALERPESIVDIWRVLGISRLTLDPSGPRQWRLADGYGTVGLIRLVHQERTGHSGMLLFHGKGGYSGSLSPRPLSGSCLLLVQHRPAGTAADDRPRQAVQIDAFLDVDGVGLEVVTRTLQPIIVRTAASNLHEICLFMATLSQAAVTRPEGLAVLANRLTRTDPEDRKRLVSIVRSVGRQAADDDDGESLRTDLASRWMAVDEVETR
jgi:hypothetical protein